MVRAIQVQSDSIFYISSPTVSQFCLVVYWLSSMYEALLPDNEDHGEKFSSKDLSLEHSDQ